MDLHGKFGMFNWTIEKGTDHIHPMDVKKFIELNPICFVFLCVGVFEEFIIIKHSDHLFRVKPELFQVVEGVKFDFNEWVKTKSKSEHIGQVKKIMWHYKKNEPMFFIVKKSERKIYPKRYFSKDLEKII